MKKPHYLLNIILILLLTLNSSAFACTAFGSISENSVIIAKNRDNNPDHQIIIVYSQPNKLKYLALSRQDIPTFVSAGVNESGLAVYNEVVTEHAIKTPIDYDLSKDILQNYSNVDAVISDLAKLVKSNPTPVFYQVADKNKAINLEIGKDGQYSYQVYTSENFAHTNSYIDKNLVKNFIYTDKIKARITDSDTRYTRINELLTKNTDYSLDAFVQMGKDHNAGHNDSILRISDISKPYSSRSLAFFAVELNRHNDNAPQVYIELYNVGEVYTLTLDKKFWANTNKEITILDPQRLATQ